MPSTAYLATLADASKVTLDYDPSRYRVIPGRRRTSSFATMGGGRVHQDFGQAAKDRRIEMTVDWLADATVAGLEAKRDTVAETWKWHDHRGDDYEVFFLAMQKRKRPTEGWIVNLEFAVVADI